MSDFCFRGENVGCNRGSGSGTKCGRWNPTTEQAKVLTQLFSSGLRNPSIDQIQKISNQLSFYGKIESKNVFYWFQNHKARERQKRRKVDRDVTRSENSISINFFTQSKYHIRFILYHHNLLSNTKHIGLICYLICFF